MVSKQVGKIRMTATPLLLIKISALIIAIAGLLLLDFTFALSSAEVVRGAAYGTWSRKALSTLWSYKVCPLSKVFHIYAYGGMGA